MLSRYRSGKLPKALKILPRLKNWREVLDVTNPDSWTPNALLPVTKIFVSSLSPRLAEIFLREILLPRIQAEIRMHKKITPHLYEALKRAMYKPEAFSKGIVLALSEDPETTLKESAIVASILEKISIPMLHSAALLLRLIKPPYSGPKFIFLKTLLDKRYALPMSVVNEVGEYFCSFENCQEKLPVLWHQSLLVFVRRYKTDLGQEFRSRIVKLMAIHGHAAISPEIIKEFEVSTSSK